MEAPVNNSEIPSSFGGVLAAFAAEAFGAEDRSAASNADGLADDVATFSYEHLLRAGSRFSAEDSPVVDGGSDTAGHESGVLENKQKSASITVRMSHAECVQIRNRAAAANLTVSAYMRSCILEAETLRAQVKEALAELRVAAPEETRRVVAHALRRWWRPWPHAGSRSAQA
jgi:hypothetical protein